MSEDKPTVVLEIDLESLIKEVPVRIQKDTVVLPRPKYKPAQEHEPYFQNMQECQEYWLRHSSISIFPPY